MDMVRVEIDSIRVSLMSQDRIIVLREPGAERYLPIWIGAPEAEAIRVELQGVPVTRPLTHDLLKAVILELGGEVEHVVVSDLRNDVFYARIKLNLSDRSVEIDSRPSDAIALAVRVKVPIYVAETVMQRAAIQPEQEISPETLNEPGDVDLIFEFSSEDTEEPEETTGDQTDLSAFEDFLDTLDLDDLEDNE